MERGFDRHGYSGGPPTMRFLKAYFDAPDDVAVEVGIGRGAKTPDAKEIFAIVSLRLLIEPPVKLCMKVPEDSDMLLGLLKGAIEAAGPETDGYTIALTNLWGAVSTAVQEVERRGFMFPVEGNA